MIDRAAKVFEQNRAERLEALGRLTGGVAHDFNNLLTIILGCAEALLEERSNDAVVTEMAGMIRVAGERGAELNSQLLSFARRQPLEPRPTEVDRLIGELEPLLRRSIGEDVELVVARTREAWTAIADAAQLETAVLNLALNARDAMPSGGKLTIETANVSLDEGYAGEHTEVCPGDYVMVAVTDTGEGMSSHVANHAFDPFFTTKAVGKGTGLGLSMVYGFVKQSGGHVKIYSEPGIGTTVKLYIPKAAAAERLPIASQEDVVPTGHEHVLVVEDDDLVREHVRKLLTGLGYKVTLAADGPTALALVDAGLVFQLLFTDVVMPGGMDGRRLADAVKSRRPDVGVLYTSGYTENAIVHHGRLDAGVHLLNKPYRKRDLALKVRAALAEPS